MPHTGLKFKIMLILQSSHHLSIFGPDDFFPQSAKLLFQVDKKSLKKAGYSDSPTISSKETK